jgi:hypothetical protein
MKESGADLPQLEQSARGLGVRPAIDVPAADFQEMVRPGEGGVSVAPDGPLNLPAFRRPPDFGGTGRDPVWVIDESELPPGLVYRPDPDREGHGFLEPAEEMSLAEYETAIASTQDRWRKVEEGEEPDNDI